jgi:hypothetical protein
MGQVSHHPYLRKARRKEDWDGGTESCPSRPKPPGAGHVNDTRHSGRDTHTPPEPTAPTHADHGYVLALENPAVTRLLDALGEWLV